MTNLPDNPIPADTPSGYAKGHHPNSTKNLTPFPPGQSGNPNGKPKGAVHLTSLLRKYINQEAEFKTPSGDKKKASLGEGIMVKLVNKALKGDIPAIRTIYDRIEGKAMGDYDPGTVKVEKQFIKMGDEVIGF
jgi:hypothetical protein